MKMAFVNPMEEIGNKILINARACNLDVQLDQITPGDGDCWYYAVIQQIKRTDIFPFVDVGIRSLNHVELRQKVSQYVDNVQNNCTSIVHYKQNIIPLRPTYNTWAKYFRDQSTVRKYADELFITATAVYIGIDIHITSEGSTAAQPFQVIHSSWDQDLRENESNGVNRPFLIIGHHSLHFQSLLPTSILPVNNTERANQMPSSYSEAVKKGKKNDMHIKFPSMSKTKVQENLKREIISEHQYQVDDKEAVVLNVIETKRAKYQDINLLKKDKRKIRYQQNKQK